MLCMCYRYSKNQSLVFKNGYNCKNLIRITIVDEVWILGVFGSYDVIIISKTAKTRTKRILSF